MKFIPREWQEPIMRFILDHPRCNIWADMGSGKTSAALTALTVLDMACVPVFPVLVLAPKRVAVGVWMQEARRWDHLQHFKFSVISGNIKERRRALHTGADIYTMNYENLQWLINECRETWKFPFVIADESTRLKGFRLRKGTKRAAALSRVANKTAHWVNLTGTPAPNGLKDTWGQNWFVDFGARLGKSYTAFKQRWFDYDPYTMELKPKSYTQPQIEGLLRDVTLTIKMSDYVDLEKPIVNRIMVDLPPVVMKQYREFEKKMFLELDDAKELTAMSAAARSIKCLQIASGAAYHEDKRWVRLHDAKLDALESVIEETNGASLVVAYWWKHDAERIQNRFKRARILKDDKDVDDWNAGKISLLLVHPQSAGHGINLQFGGHHMVFFSDWWNLETRLQVIERLGPVRQMQAGFNRPVFIYELLARGTIDELVSRRHVEKATVQETLMNAMRARRGA